MKKKMILLAICSIFIFGKSTFANPPAPTPVVVVGPPPPDDPWYVKLYRDFFGDKNRP